MTINSYFELTFHLVSKYINTLYPSTSDYKLTQIVSDTKLKQSELYIKDEKILIFSFTEISKYQSLVNVINIEGRLDNALFNWEWFSLDDIKFPLEDETEIPQDIIEKFNKKFRILLDHEKASSIFEHHHGGNSHDVEAKEPIIEEQQTDTEEIPQSATPEIPFNPPSHPPPASTTSQQPFPEQKARPADMPDFDDEYEIKSHPPQFSQPHIPTIGSDDVNPPGGSNPLMKPYLDPLQSGPDGGMYPTPNHPIFGQPPSGGNTSRLGVPPGARFDDPYGEDNLDDLGMGLPGNLRGGPPGAGGPGGPHMGGFGGPPGGFGGFGSGGSTFDRFGE
ncbi:uncharacterized protein J8A68_004171 [[Candida] subhashii]|uniref:PI31 proteasome regulator C-terminal domain-containing protein n=1 Tax=[Candida] subhashii TaxID=561895 RepID=A0A8J5QG06_9ASCO|nr:uncharacterized protein J8A68_004171 [[Candida] subhashii]KAG7662277.1 hypothetical protein J8A68_004171 [[Candida] subhashii]